ncbi:MAG: glycosyltransferase family 39 protein, partial [Nitrospirota bacterium]|nr:glycosyltransferase family 39 protein [Nitrospirota bacterium]
MILTLLLAFLATLEVWKRPSWRNYLLAGAALGLVVSSKPYGGVVALPLVAVAGLHARREPRQLLRLAAAGLAAIGLFVALNPFLGVLAEFAARNQSIYEGRGEGRLAMLRATLAAPMRLHGAVVGWAAVAGLAGLAWRSRSLSSPPAMRVPSGLIVLFVVAYALVSALLFGWVKANLWLPLAPFTALAAAFALVGAGRRLPWRGGRVLASAAGAALALALAWGLLQWVYLVRVPTTWTAASDYLAFRLPPPLSGRLIWVETPPGEFLPAVRAWTKGHATPLPVADLAAVAPQRLDRADAELFPRRRLEEDGGFYRGRLERFAASAPLVV